MINLSVFRVQFIQDYTLKSMRLKPEKWAKLVISDEQRRHLGMLLNKITTFTLETNFFTTVQYSISIYLKAFSLEENFVDKGVKENLI